MQLPTHEEAHVLGSGAAMEDPANVQHRSPDV